MNPTQITTKMSLNKLIKTVQKENLKTIIKMMVNQRTRVTKMRLVLTSRIAMV